MASCMECVELRNIYTNLTLKYRIALTESSRRVALYDLNKLRDAKIAAGQMLQDHELTHDLKPQDTELSVESHEPDGNGAILLPSEAGAGEGSGVDTVDIVVDRLYRPLTEQPRAISGGATKRESVFVFMSHS